MAKVNLNIRKNKKWETFWSRVWCPKKKANVDITLGKKTDTFTEVEAMQLLNHIKEEFNKGDCNYKSIIEDYKAPEKPMSDLTLNEVADMYFDLIKNRIKKSFLEKFQDRFNIKTEEDLLSNQLYKDKIRSFSSDISMYRKHYRVKEWELEHIKGKKKPKRVGIKEYHKIGQMRIADITKKDVLENWTRIQGIMDIQPKTKHHIISQLKTIFNYAVNEKILKHNVCNDIDKKELTKNPHNRRQRVLNSEEFLELADCLLEHSVNLNSFHATIIALTTGARAKGCLNVRKSDMRQDFENGFNDCYATVELLNVKRNRYYTLPLPEVIGRYFYYLLKDWGEDEYIVRHSNINLRTNKAFAEMPKDFKECCNMTVNSTPYIKELYNVVLKDRETLKPILKKLSMGKTLRDRAKKLRENITYHEGLIQEEFKKKRENHKEYLETHYSFHSLRHQLVSLTSVFNPLYAKRILDHHDNSDVTSGYIKAEINEIRKILEKSLKKYLSFLEPKIIELQKLHNTNFENEKKLYENNKDYEELEAEIEVVFKDNPVKYNTSRVDRKIAKVLESNIDIKKQKELIEKLENNLDIDKELEELGIELYESYKGKDFPFDNKEEIPF